MTQVNSAGMDKLVNPTQLAGMLGLDPETVRRAARAGVIPSVQFGSARRFTPEQVQGIRAKGWTRTKQEPISELKGDL